MRPLWSRAPVEVFLGRKLRADEMLTLRDQASIALRAFAASTSEGVWPEIDKLALLEDLERTIETPEEVNQGRTAFCGPAAIIYELVRLRPDRNVRFCRTLFEEGRFFFQDDRELKPSSTLKASKPSAGISPADWLTMATLRDTENLVFPEHENAGVFVQGINTPCEMRAWTQRLLGYERAEYESTYVYGEFDALKRADATVRDGGVAFLMIHSAMMGQDEPTVAFPNHWIALDGRLEIDDGGPLWEGGHVKFDCYSWGAIRRVDLGEGPFEDYMWGVVLGHGTA